VTDGQISSGAMNLVGKHRMVSGLTIGWQNSKGESGYLHEVIARNQMAYDESGVKGRGYRSC
jgi:hypothetical protein